MEELTYLADPNGKVDKPNLPFPDIAKWTGDATEEDIKSWESLTEMQQTMAKKWGKLVPGLNPRTIRRDSNFFDLGGHSVLVQRILLNIKRELGVEASTSDLYDHPDLSGFSAQIEKRLHTSNGLNGISTRGEERDSVYAQSFDELLKQLPSQYQTAKTEALEASKQMTIFLTGATGFLGSYLVQEILDRTNPTVKVIAHVRGVQDQSAGMDRIRRSLQGHGVWNDEWSKRLSVVPGDLSKRHLGLDDDIWTQLARDVDIVLCNGATVHWGKRYQDMMPSNVLSTIDAMELCNEGKPKTFCFVSSTSVLDTDHYIGQSKQEAVMEDDDLHGSRNGLKTGYGATKWVAEQLIREAGKRGLRGSIVRPGYILGDIETGVCNHDDFLIRMLKGCIQLGARPRILNTVNAVPVNNVARVVVAAALTPIHEGVQVVHVNANPRLRMNEYLQILEHYGYKASEVSYDIWKAKLEEFLSAGPYEKDPEQYALYPLYEFCVSDLPATTRAPELDDRNAVAVLKADATRWREKDEVITKFSISQDKVGRFLRYLAETEFIEWPEKGGARLPEINIDIRQAQQGGVGGRARAT